jgi:hypothetical protein
MLPLLDVFVVVLFVFATIQEQKLDSSVKQVEELQAELEARAEPPPKDAEAEARERELEAKLEQYEQACGPRGPDDPLCPAATPEGTELAERRQLDDRLMENVAVFEIELQGLPNLETDRTQIRCCFRADPPRGPWRSCGELPTASQARSDWFDGGAEGLRDALRQTKDGFAIVMVSQDDAAGLNRTMDLNSLLRDRLDTHHVYDLGVVETLGCPDFDPEG